MATPTSFSPLLEKWLKKVNPKNILEWGPGYSTKMMVELCPNAKIASIEHNSKWSEHFGRELNSSNVRIILIESPEEDRNDERWNKYTRPFNVAKFDFIFVDGRERVRCLEYAREAIKPEGVVMIHDSDREEYRKGFEGFDIIEEEHGTTCLKPKSAV